jgi:hypothetical protein
MIDDEKGTSDTAAQRASASDTWSGKDSKHMITGELQYLKLCLASLHLLGLQVVVSAAGEVAFKRC